MSTKKIVNSGNKSDFTFDKFVEYEFKYVLMGAVFLILLVAVVIFIVPFFTGQ